jgi:aryl carrier-like protein
MELHQPITLRILYPHFTDEQLEEAEANLERYLAVMMRIAERLRSEGYDLTAPDLTAPPMNATIPDVKVEPYRESDH